MPAPKGRMVGFKPMEEGFNYYALGDGNVLGVKVSVVKVSVLEGPDGKDARSPDGSPAYFYSTANVTQVLTRAEYNEMLIQRRKGR